jgi:cell wall-associated NlpC family hydrolase
MAWETPRGHASRGLFATRILVALAIIGLTLTLAAPARAEETRNADGASAQEAQAPPVGDQIAGVAMSYFGYPYVWAGNTPAGFDCSGFTQFVVLSTIGYDIGHAVEGQPASGAWIDYGAWMPGDLIFFQNTYRAGISHAGIYIGDGLFIHAENEGTGVVISSLYDGYYGPRYWGAVRVA